MGKKEQFSEEYQKLRDQLAQTGYITTGSIQHNDSLSKVWQILLFLRKR